MKRKIAKLAVVVLLLLAVSLPVMAQPRQTVTVVTPPVVVTNANEVIECSPIIMIPGSAVISSHGFLQGTCPNQMPALLLSGTATPTFTLSVGYVTVALMLVPNACSFNFLPFSTKTNMSSPQLLGMNLTSASPITFSNTQSQTQLIAGGYNYCFYYSNPPSTGLLSFNMAWS